MTPSIAFSGMAPFMGMLYEPLRGLFAIGVRALAVVIFVAAGFAFAEADAIGLRPVLDSNGDQPSSRSAQARRDCDPRLAAGGLLAGLLLGLGAAFVFVRHRDRLSQAAIDEANALAEAIIAQSGDVVLRVKGGVSSFSPSVRDLVGYDPVEMRTIAMAELIHPDDLADVVAAYASLNDDRTRTALSYRLLHRNGTEVSVEAVFGWLGEAAGEPDYIVTIRNVTQARRDAQALQLATAHARNAEAVAVEANRAKSDFLAAMTHEIRTPLNAILGFADLMMTAQDLPAHARRNAALIKGGGDALLKIVGDILDVSQAETRTLRLDPRPFALPLLIDDCIALVEGAAIAKQLALKVELVDRFPTGLLGDEGRIRQILLNLLANAIKFTAQGDVTVQVGYDRGAAGNRILFQVSDTGIGIADEDVPCLFQRFRQVDGTMRRAHGGTGLGLAVSKMLVELMGGSIGVTSVKDTGSTFWFSLSLASAPLLLSAAVPAPAPASGCLNILLVEDVPINQELARAILEAKGHRVDVVSDGADAIMAVENIAYDLVLMDIQMPYVDGFTATRAIRALPEPVRSVPIIALTANVLREHVEAAHAAGMNDFIPKPIVLETLIATVDRVGRDVRSHQGEMRLSA